MLAAQDYAFPKRPILIHLVFTGPNPTFAVRAHFRSCRQKIPFVFNSGIAETGENRLGEDLASFLRHRSLPCCC